MFYGLYKLLQVRKSLTDEACKTLVHALMTCHLDYCNARCLAIPTTMSAEGCKCSCLADIPCTKVLSHIIKYRVIFKITLLVFKVLRGLAPSYLENRIRVKPEGRYHLRNKDQLLVPKTKCKVFGDRAFFKSGPVLWNSLPAIPDKCLTYKSLKKISRHSYLALRINEHQPFINKLSKK